MAFYQKHKHINRHPDFQMSAFGISPYDGNGQDVARLAQFQQYNNAYHQHMQHHLQHQGQYPFHHRSSSPEESSTAGRLGRRPGASRHDVLGLKKSRARAKVFKFCESLSPWLPEVESYHFQKPQKAREQASLPLFAGHRSERGYIHTMMDEGEEAE